jgi:uncharacterized protein
MQNPKNLIKFMFILFFGLANYAFASTSGIVISQVFGGGGNSGAVIKNDFIELFNAGAVPVNLNGWSVQYASSTGSSWQVTNLTNVTLQPGQYYLVKQAQGAGGTDDLPTADATGAIPMAGGAGKVALVSSTTALTGATPTVNLVDAVAYGNGSSAIEGLPTSASLTSTTAAIRNGGGCVDTDINNNDFSTSSAPNPRNTSSPLAPCGGGALNQPIATTCPALNVNFGQSGAVNLSASDADSIVNNATITSPPITGINLGTFTQASGEGQSANVPLNVAASLAAGNYSINVNFTNDEAQNATCTVNVSVLAPASVTRIYTIQGSALGTASVSPLYSTSVVTEGIVTAKFAGLSGFTLQDETGDNNPLTSDGIFVFGSSALASVNVGDKIRLNANVTEFNTVTQLSSPSNIQVLSSGNPVIPTDISLPELTEGDLEAYEGMLVRIISPMTASQNFFQGRYGQVTLSANGRLIKPTNIYPPNTPQAIALTDENARRRIVLDDGISAQNPNPIPFIGADNTLRAGDVEQTITGVIDHGLITNNSAGPRDYKINATVSPLFARENNRTAMPANVGGNIKVASFNVLNYFTTFINGTNSAGQSGQGCSLGASVSASNCRGANNVTEFTRQRDKIINALAAINADVVGLIEIQNNGAVAIQNLVDGLNAKMGAGTYACVNDPATGTGDDAIKVAMIYKQAKVSTLGASLSDTDSINNRPTVAQAFVAANGEKFSVVVNHFKSKGSCPSTSANTDPDQDQADGQGCWNDLRIQQAQRLVSGFIPQVQAAAGDADIIVIGDLNAYGKEDPIQVLSDAGFIDQVARFDGQEAYSYVFDGEAGYLDHALANASMSAQISGTTHWKINADEPSVIDYNTEFKPQDLYSNAPYRSSDHDPVVIGLNLIKVVNGTTGRDSLVGTSGDDVLNGGVGADTLTGNAGADLFVFNSMRDAIDTINDFTPGVDRIQLTALLQSLGYTGSNPFDDGYARLVIIGGNVTLQIDADGLAGSSPFRTLAILKSVSVANIDALRDFIW